MKPPSQSGRVRFGVFEVDLRAGELRKRGIKIRLQQQPFQILSMLLQRPGDVLSRDELKEAIWPADTFVDFDVGLDAAIYKLRQALGDSADNPRFIETLPRRGYRFVAPASSEDDESAASAAPVQTVPSESIAETVSPVVFPRWRARRWIALAMAALAIAAAATMAVRRWLVKPPPPVIAVLPLKDLAQQSGSEYFSDALTDEIINNLSVVEGLQIRSRTSSFEFKGKPRNIREIGSQLKADLVLEGSVFREGTRLRVNVQLVRVTDDVPLWSGRYDREVKDVFEIQNEISRSIVNELRLKVSPGRRYNTNVEAYDLYLQAEQFLRRQTIEADGTIPPRIAIDLFNRAIKKDLEFAPAYAGLSDAFARISQSPRFFANRDLWRDLCSTPSACPAEAHAQMRAATEKALELDPLLAEAHSSMALIYSRERAWARAEAEFRRSIQLNPNLAEVRTDFALTVLLPTGNLEEALRQARAAIELDPLSLRAQNVADLVLLSSGRGDEALASCRRKPTKGDAFNVSQQICGRALMLAGRLNEAIPMLEQQEAGRGGNPGFLGYAYARAGRREDAEKLVAKYPEFPWVHALVYAGCGDNDRTFSALERMIEINDVRVSSYIGYPEFAALRDDSRLRDLRRKLNLPYAP